MGAIITHVDCVYAGGTASVSWEGSNLAGKTARVSVWDEPGRVLGPFGSGDCDATLMELDLEALGLDPGTYVALVNVETEDYSTGVASDPFNVV